MLISKRTGRILLVIYLVALFLLVVIKFHGDIQRIVDIMQIEFWRRIERGGWSINLIPFETIAYNFAEIASGGYLMQVGLLNLLGNTLAFVPLGFLLPLTLNTKRYTFLKGLFYCFLIILFIEIFQLITMVGSFDVDDIILNLCGCIVGYLLYKLGIRAKLLKESRT